MASEQAANLSKMQHAELRSADSSLVLRATWSWSQDLRSAGKHGGNFLDFIIEPISSSAATDHCAVAFSTIVTSAPGADGEIFESVCKINNPSPAMLFVQSAVTQHTETVTMKFLLPAQDGYIVRSDFVEESLQGSSLDITAQGFLTCGRFCSMARAAEVAEGSASQLLHLIQSSVGVIVAQHETLQALNDELQNRLSWPWTIPTPIKPTRVVIVGEKRRQPMAHNFYAAARNYDVSMIVMDNPGHWMEDESGPGPQYREHFVPFTVDGYVLDELPQRIVETIRALPYVVDGIVTTIDAFLPGVAGAAEILGLPTLGAAAYRRGTDKFETRLLSRAPTMIRVENLATFHAHLKGMPEPLQFPLIVKPVHGYGSLGVMRVDTEPDLVEAVNSAFVALKEHHEQLGLKSGDTPILIETYCEGPEVDVNMLLWNGEVLHAEITDNFPCLGDSADASSKTFGCTGSIFPSALPQDELDMLQRDVAAIVRTVGLHTGVIHAEAKVHNSAREVREEQVEPYDLRPRSNPVSGRASTFLLEVNPRPAGLPEAMGSIYTYGVNYFAAQLMHAIGDEARFRCLARGFRDKPTYQYAWLPQAIETKTNGHMPHDLGLEEFGLTTSYFKHWHYWKGGESVPQAKERPWPGLGFMMFRSLTSRQDVLQKIATARNLLKFNLE